MSAKTPKALRLIILGLACICSLTAFLVYKYMPSAKKIDLRDALQFGGRDYFVMSGTYLTDVSGPVFKSGVLYVPVDFIKQHIDRYIFWDAEADRLSITTENKVIRMNTDNLNYYVNNSPLRLSLPVYNIDGNACLPLEFVEDFYNIEISYNESSGFAAVRLLDEPLITAKLTKKTAIRFEPDIKSPIVASLEKADEVVLLEEDSAFSRVCTDSGIVGYVSSKYIGEAVEIPAAPKSPEAPVRPKNPIDGKITLLWDQVLRFEDNSKLQSYPPYPGLDVISPTWFSFDEEKLNGDIISIADKQYVDLAHERGYQVWALITDNFNSEINHAVLSDTANRENVIKQLLALAAMYELDGINIDFEALRKADAEFYLQFLRELGPLLREQGVSLSVDMFVPTFTQYYNRTEVGKVVDYICVMTYDEHYSGSETSGPVASLPFVDRGIADTLKEVPKEKVIMGMPFYVRVWRELEQGNHSIKNYAMETAYDIFIENGASFTWLEDIGSYYAEYSAVEEGEDVTYRVWLEDLRSIEVKLSLADSLGVAGVACWKRGLEADDVWDAVNNWKG